MNPSHARDLAIGLAKTDPQAALEVARTVEDPWFRAQALAWVGRFAPPQDFRAVLDEARAASFAAADDYKVVGSSAWWMRALIERGETERAALEVEGLLKRSAEIPNPVSRLDALFLLFQAVFARDAARPEVLIALVAASRVARSWKSGDKLREAALMLAPGHPDEAQQVVAAMPEGRFRRTAVERMAAGRHRTPRAFFW